MTKKELDEKAVNILSVMYNTQVQNITLLGTLSPMADDELGFKVYSQRYSVVYGDANGTARIVTGRYLVVDDRGDFYVYEDDEETSSIFNYKRHIKASTWITDCEEISEEQSKLFRLWVKEWSATECGKGNSQDIRVEDLVKTWIEIDDSISDCIDKARYNGTQVLFIGCNVHEKIDKTKSTLYRADIINGKFIVRKHSLFENK